MWFPLYIYVCVCVQVSFHEAVVLYYIMSILECFNIWEIIIKY